jgi:hypothetical protein
MFPLHTGSTPDESERILCEIPFLMSPVEVGGSPD